MSNSNNKPRRIIGAKPKPAQKYKPAPKPPVPPIGKLRGNLPARPAPGKRTVHSVVSPMLPKGLKKFAPKPGGFSDTMDALNAKKRNKKPKTP